MNQQSESVCIIDSHTGGEPTRVVYEGAPELGGGSINERLNRFRDQYDSFRQFVLNEPRGWDAVVGALLCEADDPNCSTGIIFFNNTGYLGMCGHGTIGVAVTLFHLGRIGLGKHRFETAVGVVEVDLIESNLVAFTNVPSYRLFAGVQVEVEGVGVISGDVAWGGNWFFIVEQSPIAVAISNIKQLSELSQKIRLGLLKKGITGKEGVEIDHIELMAPPSSPEVNGRSFVYCPGGAYDRSPCGTGTSAKLACLAAEGKLAPGEIWIQESVIGSRFEGSYIKNKLDQIIPSITGSGYITMKGHLVQQAGDLFKNGIPFNSE